MKRNIIISLVTIVGLGFGVGAWAVFQIQALDFVNIGTPASEDGHNLTGWGPIEPSTNGGNWGAIASEIGCDLASSTDCDKLLRVVYSGNNPAEPDHPEVVGRMATITLQPNGRSWGLVKGIKMRVLDGIANDDFMVFAKNGRGNWENVYTYISDPSTTEVWKVHNIDFSPSIWFKKPVEVAIMSTGDTWNQHATYGQLGIDWIQLFGLGRGNGGGPCSNK